MSSDGHLCGNKQSYCVKTGVARHGLEYNDGAQRSKARRDVCNFAVRRGTLSFPINVVDNIVSDTNLQNPPERHARARYKSPTDRN